jgi:uncharacterized protein
MNMKFSSIHFVILIASLLLLVANCSHTSSNVSSGNNIPVLQSEATPQNQSAPTEVKSPLPPPTGFVNDYANVIDSESKARLESVLTELRHKSDVEFAVVTIETTGGQPIFDYSLAVIRGWGVGPKDSSKGGGLLLMLAINDRQWRIQVSRSLEKDLPDEVCKELGDQSKDLYRQGKYAEGIIKYVNVIIQRLEKIRGFELNHEL